MTEQLANGNWQLAIGNIAAPTFNRYLLIANASLFANSYLLFPSQGLA